MLQKDVFILLTTHGVRLLVHPVHVDGKMFMPASYAYAMTIRRAQGSTLDFVGLLFDRRCADRGYAYVGSSRVRRVIHLWLVGRTRRTDWLPVGENTDGNEQTRPSIDSASSDSEFDSDAFDSSEFDDDAFDDDAFTASPEDELTSDVTSNGANTSVTSNSDMENDSMRLKANDSQVAEDDTVGLFN